MDINQLTDQLVQVAEDKKATSIKWLNVTELTALADYFVLMNAGNKKHAQAIADAITEKMKEAGVALLRENGYREGAWILQDFGDVIVHIFTPAEREFYDLDSMWGDAEIEKEVTGE